ncbi:MAG: glutaredoxin family protein [Burkholderiaceae bacterium]|nr:glutaredoxin family protein [Burkholderiaceae bacterium]
MRLLTLLLIALLPAVVAAQYKWTDANGRTTYGDNPPRDAKNIEPVRRSSAESSDPLAVLPLEVRRAAAAFPLTLYTAPECGACGAARELLRARGAPFSEVTLGTPQDIEAFKKLDLGEKVPVLSIGRQSVKELNPDEWHRALDSAGYPRSAYLPPSWRNPAPRPLVAPAAVPAAAPATPAPAGR